MGVNRVKRLIFKATSSREIEFYPTPKPAPNPDEEPTEEGIAKDNPGRVVEEFLEHMNLSQCSSAQSQIHLKRAMNILGIEKRIEKLKTGKPDDKKLACLLKTAPIEGQISRFTERIFWTLQKAA